MPPTRPTRPVLKTYSAARRMFTVVPLVLVSTGAAWIGTVARVPDGQIAPGTHVGTLDLSGKSREAAETMLKTWAATQQRLKLTLRLPSESRPKRTWTFEAARLGLGIDVPATLNEAARSRPDGLMAQVSGVLSGSGRTRIAPRIAVNAEKLRRCLKELRAKVRQEPRNARLIVLSQGGFGRRHERPGRDLDLPASEDAVRVAWSRIQTAVTAEEGGARKESPQSTRQPAPGQTAEEPGGSAPRNRPEHPEEIMPRPDGEPRVVVLAVKTIPAAITMEDLSRIDGELGGYSTRFGGTGANRGSNIALAASRINGTLLKPGDVFSYNKTVGPRIGKAGFKTAPVIVRGELVPGMGGGICQVSTTLYNAVLLANLKIVRRSHHAFPVHYVSPGRDATVVDGAIDFQFQNSTDSPVYLSASARHGRLTFHVFGHRAPGRDVRIELANRSVQPAPREVRRDSTLPLGRRVVKDRGHRGHRVTVYRVVRENGKVVQRELIARDHYKPFPSVVLVGIRPGPERSKKPNPSAPATGSPETTTPAPAPARGGE